MYLNHFGLNEPPFKITPLTEFFYDGGNRGATLDALVYAITYGEGIVKVTGEVGSGKTMLCRVLMERLPENVETIYLANPSLSRDEILYAIADDLKLEISDGNRVTVVTRALQDLLIEKYGQGKQVVVLVDEAHAMPLETLEEIRLLSNLESSRHKLLQIVLFGQPELNDNLNIPSMRQLKERITHSFVLPPLIRPDIREYLNFRMRAAGYRGPEIFTPAALRLIAKTSQGLTRRINILADKSMLAAFSENTHGIQGKHVRAAIRDSEFSSFHKMPSRYLVGFASLAIGLAMGLGLQFYGTKTLTPAAPSQASSAKPETSKVVAVAPISPPVTVAVAPVTPPPAQQQPPVVTVAALPEKLLSTPRNDLLQQRIEAGKTLLKNASDKQVLVEVKLDNDPNLLEQFLSDAKRNGTLNKIYIYPGKTNMTVLQGVYPNWTAARDAVNRLPKKYKSNRPLLRSVSGIRSELRHVQ